MNACTRGCLLSAVLAAFSAASAEEALVRPQGRVEFDSADISIAPTLFYPGWVSRAPDGGWRPAEDGARAWTFRAKSGDQTTFDGSGRYAATADGSFRVVYGWKARAQTELIYACLAARLPLARYGGGSVTIDGRTIALPKQRGAPQLWGGSATNFVFRDAAGRETLALSYATPRKGIVQDNRPWKGDDFTVRVQLPEVKAAAPGQEVTTAFTLRAPEPIACEPRPVVLKAGPDWIPLVADWHVVPGSALDFSKFRGTEGPAGKHGYPVVRNGHFEFENLPGVAQRFYGCNVVSSANYPDEALADEFAAAYARIGYNAVRFHHHDGGLSAGPNGKLNAENMRRFDRLFAALVREGVYVTTDLYVSRRPLFRDLGIDRKGRCEEIGVYKKLVVFHEPAYQDLIAYSRAFLDHVNPFTRRRYADEPALGWLSLVNEGNLRCGDDYDSIPGARAAWQAWLKAHPSFADVPDAFPKGFNAYSGQKANRHQTVFLQFLAEREALFARRMKRFLREEMKCRALVTDMNLSYAPTTHEVVRAEEYDYVDTHFYVDHPHFLEKKWRLPSSCPNANPIAQKTRGARNAAGSRVYGKPFAITEYNYSGPGRVRGVGGIATAAFAALQDWDGLWRFAWSHGDRGIGETKAMSYFDMSGDPLSLASERASVLAFLRRDVAPLKPAEAFLLPPDAVRSCTEGLPFNVNGEANWVGASWHARFGVVAGRTAPKGVHVAGVFPQVYDRMAPWPAEDDPTRLPCGGGAVTADGERGVFTLKTPRTAGGFAEKGTIDAGVFTAELRDAAATVWASSLDDQPIATSRRLLVTHLTDVQNTGMTYADKSLKVLLAWGDLPHLMRRGRAEVALALAPGSWKVHALETTGARRGEVPFAYREGRLVFTADVARAASNATFLYEVTR